MEHVRAELRRSGGFAGLTSRVLADSATMSPADAVRFVQLVAKTDLSRLDRPAARSHGADLMHYELTVERGGERWHGTVSDPDIPAELRPLLQFLTHYSPGATP
ncbi:protealysin inhibitor emfourin [Actinoplanes sp. NPDC051513]|uniref:protealysin inhibitor emfourin n=1 Tax=Actinoplanes sp. NPDC051513 TaxID=3363908 RepID=UPI0037B00F6F